MICSVGVAQVDFIAGHPHSECFYDIALLAGIRESVSDRTMAMNYPLFPTTQRAVFQNAPVGVPLWETGLGWSGLGRYGGWEEGMIDCLPPVVVSSFYVGS